MNKEVQLLQRAGVFALACVGVLALTGVYYLYSSVSQGEMRTFNVQGKGEVEARANKATISSDFVAEATQPGDASAKLSELSKTAFAELEKAGVKKEDIKTASVSTNPKYDYCYNYSKTSMPGYCIQNPNEPKIVGYTSSQNFTITIKDNTSMVEKLLGLLPTLGARNTYGPSWEVDSDEAIAEARKLAVEEAKAKAQSIADSLGMKLGEVQYYSENNGGGYPVPMMYNATKAIGGARLEAQDAASIPVSEGLDKVTVNVDITYKLK